MKIHQELGGNVPIPTINTQEQFYDGLQNKEIKAYESTDAHMYDIKSAQDNLNANPTNAELVEKFVERATNTRSALKAKYDSAHWVDPSTTVVE